MNQRLYNLLLATMAEDINIGIQALDDLGLLLEKDIIKHTSFHYERFLHSKELSGLKIEEKDRFLTTSFLFYLLMNFPDRSFRTAWCLVRCYDTKIYEGLCQAIELYIYKSSKINVETYINVEDEIKKYDTTVWYLIKAITDDLNFNIPNERILSILKIVSNTKLLSDSKAFANEFIDIYIRLNDDK